MRLARQVSPPEQNAAYTTCWHHDGLILNRWHQVKKVDFLVHMEGESTVPYCNGQVLAADGSKTEREDIAMPTELALSYH